MPTEMLITDRLSIRPVEEHDLDVVFRGLSHPDVIRYYGVQFHTREGATEQMRWYADLVKTGTGHWFAICLKDTHIMIGAIGFNNWSILHRKAELGFWLLPEHWRQGFISEAIAPVCAHGFSALHLHRIEAHVETENTASSKVLLRNGFQLEGTLRDTEWKNDRFISLHIYGLLRNEAGN